ncbi:MAG TPA: 30S ribosomal protein S20 [Bdellovibrionota bacterium]|nr:30S ribosomal protein S20 [Bdellovibrionota bacterium]
MARHPSAEKRHRESLDRQEHNRWWKSRVRAASRTVLTAVEKKDKKGAAETLKAATKEIFKARSKGIIHPNNAARKVARLSRLVSTL